ncbi:winged helix-turn-helix transcriptional regulator [Rhizobium dioscoreae]|uniref:winged helix-turn-helix transcriptional regulator n=1 Tax=Rhizobium TaxID=379 RepID=UPI001F36E3F3|nr:MULTISPECIES: helix-turn-helix domain-containing protein [Rhizobium]
MAQSLDRIGEWWSILILRDAMRGVARFDDFQKNLGIGTATLTRRLDSLVEAGLLEKQMYQERPRRFEYVLTACGEDFRPVLWSLIAWGNRHFAPEGPSLVIVDTQTGAWADPILVDRETREPIAKPKYEVAAGPNAREPLTSRYRLKSEGPGSTLIRIPPVIN